MYHAETPTDKTIREWYMNSSRVAACALRNEQAVRADRPGRPVSLNLEIKRNHRSILKKVLFRVNLEQIFKRTATDLDAQPTTLKRPTCKLIRGVDKSLARPGRKQATATKL